MRLKEKLRETLNLLPIIAFAIPFIMLYLIQDVAFSYSFEATWKGRAFYIFFIWFSVLEMIVSWEKLQPKAFKRPKYVRTIALILALSLPTIYVVVSNFYGLNEAIYEWSKSNRIAGAEWAHSFMPLSIEYLAFATFFFLIIFLQYGIDGFRRMLLAPTFLATMGIIYMIDNLYPYGRFAPLQIPATVTATVASSFLNLMGYQTSIAYIKCKEFPQLGWAPDLFYYDPALGKERYVFTVAWPCSGVESLIIYTLFMLIFLRDLDISRTRKIIYFVIGAIITYFINIGRIIALFIIAINYGGGSELFTRFHEYYGQLISISWIAAYPLLIMVGGNILQKIKFFIKFLKKRLS